MLIAQISDLHIRAGPAGRVNDARLLRVLEQVADARPDLVIATGDLVDHGDLDSYRRLAQMLAELPMPVRLGVGNHDRRGAMLRVFPDTPADGGELRYVIDIGARRVIMLDTLLEGRHGGHCSQAQADWLAARLGEAPERPTLIALHHPPVDSGIAWMDVQSQPGWALPLERAVAGHAQIVGYVAGHIHRGMAMQFMGRPLVVAPSCAPQVALDLLPLAESRRAGRPMIVAEAPGFVLHRWTDAGLVSHFAAAGTPAVLARHRGDVEQEDMAMLDWMEERQDG